MRSLQIFYQKDCPHCQKAFKFIEELKEEKDIYRLIEPRLIEETLEVDYAALFDYFLVPTFYIDEIKVHEGVVSKEQVREILEQALRD
jgi:glutaredoxin